MLIPLSLEGGLWPRKRLQLPLPRTGTAPTGGWTHWVSGPGEVRGATLWSDGEVWGVGPGVLSLCLWSRHPRRRGTQVLLATTEAMELRRRDYRVERPLLNQEQLEELGRWGPAPRTRPWRTSLQ